MSLREFGTINYWADDVAAAAVAWYTELLGVEPYFMRSGADGRPAYVEFRIGDYQAALGIIDRTYEPAGAATGPGGPIMYWHVDDLNATVELLLSMGSEPAVPRPRAAGCAGAATEYQPITPHGEAGFVTAAVVDPFGNVLGVMYNPHYLDVLASTKAA